MESATHSGGDWGRLSRTCNVVLAVPPDAARDEVGEPSMTLQVAPSDDERIEELYIVLASRKVAHLPAPTGDASSD